MNFSVDYSEILYRPDSLRVAIECAVEILGSVRAQFDSIVVRGVSGTVFGGALSIALGVPLFVVRKPGESSHSSGVVSGVGDPGRWLFVDDFVCSGDTRLACEKAIGPGRVGTYTYSSSFRWDEGLFWIGEGSEKI